MATGTEHTPQVEPHQDGHKGRQKPAADADHLWWIFQTPAGVNEDDLRAALELVGAEFNPDRDQVAMTDGYNEYYGGMTSSDGETAVNSLYDALDCSAEYRGKHPECRSFADLSRAEKQEFMDFAVGCYSFITEGNFNDTDQEVLNALLAILTGTNKH